MKTYILLLSFLLSLNIAIAQNSNTEEFTPVSYLDVSLGLGPNYGLFGGKFVLGYKGNGMLLGMGSIEGRSATAIGIQLSYKYLFFNITNADYGLYSVTINNSTTEGTLQGTVYMIGGKGGFGKSKKVFFEFGFGIARGGVTPSPNGPIEENQSVITFGLGYRIG